MDINLIIAIVGSLLTVVGLFLGPISRFLERIEAKRLQAERFREMMERHPGAAHMSLQMFESQSPAPPPKPKGFTVLVIFAVIVAIFGVFTAVHFWGYLRDHVDKIFFAA